MTGYINPKDRQGKIMRCFKCNSTKHFVRDCTSFYSRNNINTVVDKDQVNFTLFNVDSCYRTLINDSYSNVKMSNLVKETLGMAVLDSACSQTVAGEIWFNVFFDTLNGRDKRLVETVRSNRIFCFEDGVEVRAIKTVKFPVTIGGIRGIRGYIEADIVKNDVPLLLSHKSMKTAGILLNFKKRQLSHFWQTY